MPSPEPVCPFCGAKYRDFRTGLTYRDVYGMLWTGSGDSADWKYKRRNTVLGKWHQIKVELWNRHLDGCAKEDAAKEELSKVPF